MYIFMYIHILFEPEVNTPLWPFTTKRSTSRWGRGDGACTPNIYMYIYTYTHAHIFIDRVYL